MQIIHVAIVLLLAGWAFLNYIRFVKRRDENLKRQYEISLSPNSGKRYEYELWIRKMGHEQVIHLYSDSPRHHIDSIHHYFYHQSKGVYKIENGEEIFITEFVTGKDSTDLKGLKPGQYVLRELKEPKGYLKAKDVPFTVTDTHEVVHVTMIDEFDRTVPTTGLNDLLPMIAGVGLVSVGTILYLKRKRHN